jgi:murein L,D-transpeptidase YcbB/YkuD
MKTNSLKFNIIFLTLSVLISANLFSQDNSVSLAIQHRIETGMEQGGITVGEKYLFNQDSLAKYYINRHFQPVWSDAQNRTDFIEIIEGAYDEGLTPNDYHLQEISALLEKVGNGKGETNDLVDLDLLMSDGISLYANHLNYGKVMQSKLRETWDVPENPMPDDPDFEIENALSENTLPQLFETFTPQFHMYRELKVGLRNYRQIEKDDGWPIVADGETLKKGMTDNRIATIRTRLKITGDLKAETTTNPELFDEELELAVKHFQFRHALTQDGVIGKGTLAQMNVPVEKRIDQIRVNLERSRWIMHKLEKDFLIVNIAGYNIRRVTDDSIVYFSPVIVGKPLHETPIFKATMQYFVINPTWTVPYSIATSETLPKMRKNPNYLAEHNMVIMDRNGKILDPATIDLNKYSKGNFPFTVRQEPGPNNALGEVKFIFPNHYSVYVHDTPGRSLFTHEERAFSHGCIRLQKKWELLMSLMDEPDVWNMDKINEILASGKTTTVHLNKPIDILILYWTAGADKQDRIYFDQDIYKRDPAVLAELDKPWEYKKIN